MNNWPVAIATHAARDLIGKHAGKPSGWSTLLAFLEKAECLGFDGVDIATTVFDVSLSREWWMDLSRQIELRNLRIASINCLRSSLADPDHWRSAENRIEAALRHAAELGIPSVNVSLAVPPERADANAQRMQRAPLGSSRTATEEDFRLTARRLDRLAEIGSEANVAVAVELHHASIADTAPATLRLLEFCEQGVEVNPDLVNELWAFDTVAADWRDTLSALAPYTHSIWHVKNCWRRTEGELSVAFEDAPLGNGEIDYQAAFSIMVDSGFTGWISIERSGPGDFLATAQDGIRFIRDWETTHQRKEEKHD